MKSKNDLLGQIESQLGNTTDAKNKLADNLNKVAKDKDALERTKSDLDKKVGEKDKIVGNLADKLKNYEKIQNDYDTLLSEFNLVKAELDEIKPFAREALRKIDDITYENKNITADYQKSQTDLQKSLDNFDKSEHQKKKLLITHALTNFELERQFVKQNGDIGKINNLTSPPRIKSPGLRRTKVGGDNEVATKDINLSAPGNPLVLAISQVESETPSNKEDPQPKRNSTGQVGSRRNKKR